MIMLEPIHTLTGFVLFCLLFFIPISGWVCKYSHTSTETLSKKVVFNNHAHSIFGWCVILAAKVAVYSGAMWSKQSSALIFTIMGLDIISHLVYLYLKFFGNFFKKPKVSVSWLRDITSSKDLAIYSNNYFIFYNYVFELDKVLTAHPGGVKIIQHAKGREVDRYLYGVEPMVGIPDVDPYIHSSHSINLAGEPLARIPPSASPYPSLAD